jgi:4-hydroxy-tetrahydrodipicolinate synthase
MVALATPFRDGALDESAFRKLIRHCIDGGLDAIIPCGTTGEAVTLDDDEYRRTIEIAVDEAKGSVPVFAGTGSNSTQKTIKATKLVKELGCHGALIVTPYYNKPTQAGLEAHYREVAGRVGDFPIILYNVPGRTGVNMLPETVARLSDIDTFVAVKEACGNLGQVEEVLERVGHRMAVLSGDDALTLPMYALGSHGVISVAANVVPAEMKSLKTLFDAGDTGAAAQMQQRLNPLFRALFVESNPIPLKAALWLLGIMRNELRLPLVPAQRSTIQLMQKVLSNLGLEVRSDVGGPT